MLNDKIYLIDGGLSTELMCLGYKPDETKLWTGNSIVERPDLLKQAHLNFLKSGSDIITTASYQLSVDLIEENLKCTNQKAYDIIKQSFRIAKEAVKEANLGSEILIAGSIGPYGACLCDGSEYVGHYAKNLTIDFLIDWHRPRFESLLEEGCDLFAFETIPSIKEARALIKLLSEHPNVKAWLSFSCKNESEISSGDRFRDAYQVFKDNMQLIAIGINCTYPKYIEKLLESVSNDGTVSKPFIIYSNDAKIWDNSIRRYVNSNNEDPMKVVMEAIPKWIKLGAQYIGGCCNINSENIQQIKNFISDNHI
ncbi:unnamed protein product [Brachionus calyciflorus]|uniref:Hcy-binding domain-containing protein n=1 Tax=Brachionus calyciflorus TaxID=104777 RepID=A0A813QMA2_9BILA|nr:unnamed protein product [Brachionus calyciflorus]